MFGIVPLLLALNIIVATVATPTLVSGLGLGSGAAGSSFKQEIRESSDSDVKAATTLFKLTCDQDSWGKTKQAEEPDYPQSEADIKKLFSTADTIGMARFGELCQPHDQGKSGVVFVDPASGNYDNGIEMFHLFSGHWDKRSLTAIYYLYQKRFSDKGFQVECKKDDKTAPIMTLAVAGGYVDENGQPTALAKTGIEDDKNAGEGSRQVNSAHARGQSVDIKTFGCTIITGENPNVVANNIGYGQDDKAQLSDIASQALSSYVDASGQDLSDIEEGMAETKANSSNLNNAGIAAAGRAGGDPVQTAADISRSDNTPSIIPVGDTEAEENPNPSSPAFPETAKDRIKDKLSVEDRAAQFLERSYEKQLSLPAGSLAKGANVMTIGRKALYDQTGIMLSDKPTSEEMAEAAALLAAHSNPDFALLVPQEAITELGNGNYDLAYKIAGAARINAQFSLDLSNAEIAAMARSGVTSDQLITYIERNRELSDQDREYIKSLLDQGYVGLKTKLDKAQASRDQSPSGQLLTILKNSPVLNDEQTRAIKDFSNKDHRPGVAQRLINSKGPEQLIGWVNNNQNISEAEAKVCKDILDTYAGASDPKTALENTYPSVHTSTITSSTLLMDGEEKAIFNSVFGANPSPKDIKEGIKAGKLKVAGEAYIFSKGLQRAGFSSAQASYLGLGIAQDRLNGTDVGLAKLNNELGKKVNVTVTKEDIALLKNGKFKGAQKLAIGAIASKTKLPVKKVFDFFTKKDNSDNATGKSIKDAFSKDPKLTDKTNKMLNALTTKGASQQASIAASTSSAGAKAKAKALAGASAEGATAAEANADRKSTSDKLEQTFDKGLEKGKTAAKQEGKEVLISKGLNDQEANQITDGKLKGAEKTMTNSVLAKRISRELPPGTATPEQVKLFLNGKGTKEEKETIKDGLIKKELEDKGITYTGSRSISDTLQNGTTEERKAMMTDFGKQYGAKVLQDAGAEAEPRILIDRNQAMQVMNGNLSGLGTVAGQTAVGEALSRATGMEISTQTASRIYSAITDVFDNSPKPTTSYPSSTSAAQVGLGSNGESNPGDAAHSALNQDPAYDVPSNLPAAGTAADEPPQGVGNPSPNTQANTDANAPATPAAQAQTSQDKLETIGWGIAEEKLGFSREAITNLESNIKNLPDNIVDYYQNFDYTGALSNLAAGVIVNKLLGNTLAKIDPTGGILSSYVMYQASAWIASLGISMPILLGISLLIDFKGTIQAIKGLVTMALQIFTDPIGFVLSFLGFFGLGKKKPKATNAAKNAVKAAKTDTIDGKIVDSPIEPPTNFNPQMTTFLGGTAYAADAGGAIQATSAYLPAKKPSEEQFKKISRRTVDQVIEDLLLFSLAASVNQEAIKDPAFLQNHWNAFMDIPNPKNKSYVIKQLVSPRAIITDAEADRAKALGITDALYAKENAVGLIGYKQIVNYARMLYGDDFLPSKANARVSGLLQNRAIKAQVHASF